MTPEFIWFLAYILAGAVATGCLLGIAPKEALEKVETGAFIVSVFIWPFTLVLLVTYLVFECVVYLKGSK